MRRVPRLRAATGAIVVLATFVAGTASGGALGLLGHGPDSPRTPAHAQAKRPSVRLAPATTMLVWTPGGLPAGYDERVARLPGVAHEVAVWSATLWLAGAAAPDGTQVDAARRGFGEPIEVAGADPDAYAPFLAPADRAVLAALARGEAALGATAAASMVLGPGSILRFGAVSLLVSAILPDAAIGANEVFVSASTARRLGIQRRRYLLVAPVAGASRERLMTRMRALLPPGTAAQIRGPGETPYFRQGDAVLPPVVLNQLFGSFAARPLPARRLQLDPEWVTRHIVSARVPILGTVRCNRAMIPQLLGALTEVERQGLAHLIDRRRYGGCYRPSLLRPADPQAGVSHHTWGIAIDLNLSTNRLGAAPRQDPRLVAIFERWGFTWGGRWLVPFGAQFELVRLQASA